jgi:hypothetical protein
MRSCILRYLLLISLLLFNCERLSARALEEVPQAAVDEMGVTEGKPLMNGFVFINGRYLPPPYTVRRVGNAICINKEQIEQPVPWSYCNPDSLGGMSNNVEDAELLQGADNNADATAAEMEKNKDSPADQLPAKVTSIDDLFGDPQTEKATQETAQPPAEIRSIDDLFNDEESVQSDSQIVRAPPVSVAKPARRVMRPPENISDVELKRRKMRLKKSLDEKRAFFERHLARGEMYFFGATHDRINGTYGSARMLLEVLPEALRYARNPQDLLRRLHNGNVYFLDYSICEALFANQTTFPLIQQRRDQIRQDEAVKETLKKQSSQSGY